MLRRVEVRCCCRPEKLLGWLPVDEARIFVGSRVKFLIAPARTFKELGLESVSGFEVEVLTLPILEAVMPGELVGHPALKSEETPIEVLRRIPGFVENKP